MSIISYGNSGCTVVSSQMNMTCVRVPLLGMFLGTNTGTVSACGVNAPCGHHGCGQFLLSPDSGASIPPRMLRYWPVERDATATTFAPGRAPTGFQKAVFVFSFWGLFPAQVLITNDAPVPVCGADFRPKNGAGRGSKNASFFTRFARWKTAVARICGLLDGFWSFKILRKRVALFEQITHYSLWAAPFEQFAGRCCLRGRSKRSVPTSSAPSIGSPICLGCISGAAVATQFIVCANPGELFVHRFIRWHNGSSFISVLHPFVHCVFC